MACGDNGTSSFLGSGGGYGGPVMQGVGLAMSCKANSDARDRARALKKALEGSGRTAIQDITRAQEQVISFGEQKKDFANVSRQSDIDTIQEAASKDVGDIYAVSEQTEVAQGFAGSGAAEEFTETTLEDLYTTLGNQYEEINVETEVEKMKIDMDTASAMNTFTSQINTILGQFAGATGSELTDYAESPEFSNLWDDYNT